MENNKKRNKDKNMRNIQNDNIGTKASALKAKEDAAYARMVASEYKSVKNKMVKSENKTEHKTENSGTKIINGKINEKIKEEGNDASEIKRAEPENAKETKKEKKADVEHVRAVLISSLKILLPVAACVIVIAVIASFVNVKKNKEEADEVSNVEETVIEPLEENAYAEVNELMNAFYTALADGDMDTVKALKDHNEDKELITYEKKSEFIEAYENINCYTKKGLVENSYFVYVTYDLKVNGIETRAPGLEAFYVYPGADGSLQIDGRKEESTMSALRIITNQDDVVDLYKKVDVSYAEAVAADAALNDFLTELPNQIKASVGEALAQLETQTSDNTENTDVPAETEGGESDTPSEPVSEAAAEPESAQEQPPQNQVVNQTVRAVDTVNVRSSDSEEADKLGKVEPGTELTRIEEKINGWSKVIFEGREAYIKSDYLEVVAANATEEPAGTNAAVGSVTAITNVNVRNAADQGAEKVGTAQGGASYELLEDMGEWYKINFNGSVAYVKAEYFTH